MSSTFGSVHFKMASSFEEKPASAVENFVRLFPLEHKKLMFMFMFMIMLMFMIIMSLVGTKLNQIQIMIADGK